MYLFYEWTHYSFHMKAPTSDLGLLLRKHHFAHHFTNPHFNHGVTSTIADRIFGSYMNVQKVFIPRRFAMNWLVDDNGQVKMAFRNDFEVRG